MLPTEIKIQSIDGHPRVTSLQVAEHFGRRHDNVLRDIAGLLSDLNSLEVEGVRKDLLNFEEISVPDSYGRQQPAYSMTKDGFTLLVMGYTGPDALKLKVLYINEFNRMAEILSDPQKVVDYLIGELVRVRREGGDKTPFVRKISWLGRTIEKYSTPWAK